MCLGARVSFWNAIDVHRAVNLVRVSIEIQTFFGTVLDKSGVHRFRIVPIHS